MTDKDEELILPDKGLSCEENVSEAMINTLTAVLPVISMSVYLFGFRSLCLVLGCAVSCIIFQWLILRVQGKSFSYKEQALSGAVTGVLLALTLPPALPYWLAAVASFAAALMKQLSKITGRRLVNAVIFGHVILYIWPYAMSTWTAPLTYKGIFNMFGQTAATVTTPLGFLTAGQLPEFVSLGRLFKGVCAGALGETSALLLLIGGLYLIYKKVISYKIPLSFIVSAAVLFFIFPRGQADRLTWMLHEVLSGGIILGAVFIASDSCTSPDTAFGQIMFGAGCGIITVIIRMFGPVQEGVAVGILVMNLFTGYLDKLAIKLSGLMKAKS